MAIFEWWNSLGIAVQIFYCLAVPSTLVLIIQTVMMFLGFGEDGDGIDDGSLDSVPDIENGDLGTDIDPDALDAWGFDGLRIFTLRGIIAFFVVFGWVGVVMLGEGVKLWLTIVVASLCGFAMMVALAFLFRLIMKLRSVGNANNQNAIGTSGKVYLTIPPIRSGSGKVNIMLQGSYVERDAVTDSDEEIPTGSEVVVVGLSGQTDLVVRKK